MEIVWIIVAIVVAVAAVAGFTALVVRSFVVRDQLRRRAEAESALNFFEASPDGLCFSDTCSVRIRYFTNVNQNQPVRLNLTTVIDGTLTTVSTISNEPSNFLQIPVEPGGFTNGPGVYVLQLEIDSFPVIGHRVVVFGAQIPLEATSRAEDQDVLEILTNGLILEFLVDNDEQAVVADASQGVKAAGRAAVCKGSRLVAVSFEQGDPSILAADRETVGLQTEAVDLEIRNAANDQSLASGAIALQESFAPGQPIPVDAGLRVRAVPKLADPGVPLESVAFGIYTLTARFLLQCDDADG